VELSDKTFVNISKAAIPPEAKEGAVIDVTVDEAVQRLALKKSMTLWVIYSNRIMKCMRKWNAKCNC